MRITTLKLYFDSFSDGMCAMPTFIMMIVAAKRRSPSVDLVNFIGPLGSDEPEHEPEMLLDGWRRSHLIHLRCQVFPSRRPS